MKLVPQKATYLGDITYTGEDTTLNHIETCGRLCYRSELSKSIEARNNILNAWHNHGHTSLYEHSQVVLYTASIFGESVNFIRHLFSIGLYRFFDLDFFYDFHIIAGNLRAWTEAYDKIGEEYPRVFAGIKAAFPKFMRHWECESNPSLIVPKDKVPHALHRYAAYIKLDRGVLAEWTRHDFGFSVESSRYCNYSKDKYGGEIQIHDQDVVGFAPKDGTRTSEEAARMIWKDACTYAEKAYMNMLEYVKPDIARQVLNMSLIARMYVSGLPWYWDNFFKLRDDSAAHANIRYLAHDLKNQMYNNGYNELR